MLYGVKEVIISSIFIKRQFKRTRIIRQVNAHLRDECRSNKFHFISNDSITNECLRKNGLPLNNDGTYLFASNLVDFLKVVSATFLPVCFLSLNESSCQTRKNVFYFTSKAFFVLEKIKFYISTFSNFMTSSNA